MVVRLELGDLLLPVGVEDVAILASEALVDLEARQHDRVADETRKHTFAHWPVKTSGFGAWPCAAI